MSLAPSQLWIEHDVMFREFFRGRQGPTTLSLPSSLFCRVLERNRKSYEGNGNGNARTMDWIG